MEHRHVRGDRSGSEERELNPTKECKNITIQPVDSIKVLWYYYGTGSL